MMDWIRQLIAAHKKRKSLRRRHKRIRDRENELRRAKYSPKPEFFMGFPGQMPPTTSYGPGA